MNKVNMILPSSFHDPLGFLFFREGILYRQINRDFQDHYHHMIDALQVFLLNNFQR